ncbi:hypothetical protein FDENT_9795 [Fusarium denticulatum]|uniref:Uncharacterized protein n=1 Tax=Fusarium denticulatum TaxID=48507 RepID=A0A8H5WTW2_9HYPO|nr:hypothetical protein FDENT_9795 [Fusarium denticulatum]
MRISMVSVLVLVIGALAAPASDNSGSLDKRCEWNDGHGPISCIVFGAEGRERSEFIIKGNNFEQRGFPRCDPYSLRTGGTICILSIQAPSNAPTDTRCGPVENGWGRSCIIAQRP